MVRNHHLAATLPQPSGKSLCEWFPLRVKQAGKLRPIFIVVQIEVRWLHAEAGEKSSHHLFHFGKWGRVRTCVPVPAPRGRGRRRTTALPVAADLPAALTWLLCFEGEPQKKEMLFSKHPISRLQEHDSLPADFYILIVKKKPTGKQKKTHHPTDLSNEWSWKQKSTCWANKHVVINNQVPDRETMAQPLPQVQWRLYSLGTVKPVEQTGIDIPTAFYLHC